jgi:hypothetical protein
MGDVPAGGEPTKGWLTREVPPRGRPTRSNNRLAAAASALEHMVQLTCLRHDLIGDRRPAIPLDLLSCGDLIPFET